MNRHQVETRAHALFENGTICAEAVLLAVLEGAGIDGANFAPAAATCFGGGVGRSKEELCGALSGGLIALGLLRGRNQGLAWDEIAPAAAELRRRTKDLCGHTRCKDILEALGPQDHMDKCRRLTADVAGIVAELAANPSPASDGATCGCCQR